VVRTDGRATDWDALRRIRPSAGCDRVAAAQAETQPTLATPPLLELPMKRRPAVGRAYEGRRSTIRTWLRDHGMAAGVADAWLAAWEAGPRAAGVHPDDPNYWNGAVVWIVEQRTSRNDSGTGSGMP
jgi:hypothetical protein